MTQQQFNLFTFTTQTSIQLELWEATIYVSTGVNWESISYKNCDNNNSIYSHSQHKYQYIWTGEATTYVSTGVKPISSELQHHIVHVCMSPTSDKAFNVAIPVLHVVMSPASPQAFSFQCIDCMSDVLLIYLH